MKIQRSYVDYSSLTALNGVKPSVKQAKTQSAGDRVNISDTAQQLLAGAKVHSSDSGIDSAKVARLKAAINNGTYTVSAQNIADRMLAAVDEERA